MLNIYLGLLDYWRFRDRDVHTVYLLCSAELIAAPSNAPLSSDILSPTASESTYGSEYTSACMDLVCHNPTLHEGHRSPESECSSPRQDGSTRRKLEIACQLVGSKVVSPRLFKNGQRTSLVFVFSVSDVALRYSTTLMCNILLNIRTSLSGNLASLVYATSFFLWYWIAQTRSSKLNVWVMYFASIRQKIFLVFQGPRNWQGYVCLCPSRSIAWFSSLLYVRCYQHRVHLWTSGKQNRSVTRGKDLISTILKVKL